MGIRIAVKGKNDCVVQWLRFCSVIEKEKQLFIQRCEERDNDTFQIDYRDEAGDIDYYYINAKNLMRYLAMLIGVSFPSNSLRFGGRILEDGKTIFVDLKEYYEIPYECKQTET